MPWLLPQPPVQRCIALVLRKSGFVTLLMDETRQHQQGSLSTIAILALA